MDGNRQCTLVLIVCQSEQLLKGAAIHHTDQKIEAHIMVGNQGKQGNLFLSQRSKLQFVGCCQSRNRSQIELFQSCSQSDLNGFQSFGATGMVVLVILHGDMVWVSHFQSFKEFIQWGLIGVIIFPDFTGPEHFHNHGEVLFFLRCFIEKVKDDCRQQHGCCRIPERVIGLTAFWGGCFEQARYQLLYIVIRFQIRKGIEAVAFFHGEKIQHLDFITPFL